MKKFLFPLFAFVLTLLCANVAFAQAYAYTNPTYIPNATLAPVTLSAPSTVPFQISGVGTVSVRVSGTCTALAAVAQATNDGTNWTTVNLYPIATGTSAPIAVASIAAVGFWKLNASGYSQIRMNVTALTASCTFAIVGHSGGFNGTTF